MSGRSRSDDAGQGLVEFALVLPVFILMLFGLIDVGRFVYMSSVMSQGAREGARVAAAEASWIGKTITDDPSCVTSAAQITSARPGTHVCPPSVLGGTLSLQSDIIDAANRMVAPFGAVQHVYFSCQPAGIAPPPNWTNTDCPAGNRTATKSVVWVRVEMTFNPITPIIGQIGTFSTSGSATMVVN